MSIDGHAICRPCAAGRAEDVDRTPAEFCDLAECIAKIAARYGDSALVTLDRIGDETANLVGGVERALQASAADRARGVRKLPEFQAEDVITDPVAEAIDDGVRPTQWLSEQLAILLLAASDEAVSVLDLVVGLFGDPEQMSGDIRALKVALLGRKFRVTVLSQDPYRSRLLALNAAQFALGMVRLARLSELLEVGCPPTERYSAEERAAYRMLYKEPIRRISRTYWVFEGECSFAHERNDRAERINAVWLLHPVGVRLQRYMSMMHGAFVEGRSSEVIILCRTVLERAIGDAVADLSVETDRMNTRIQALESAGRVTSRAANYARAVWQRGNKVIHDDPGFDVDSFATIEMLMAVLDELGPILSLQP